MGRLEQSRLTSTGGPRETAEGAAVATDNPGAGGDGPADALDVVAFPDYRAVNPYQRELERELADRGVSATTTGRGTKWAPLLSAVSAEGRPDVLHVHFFHQVMIASSAPSPIRPFVSALLSLRLVLELTILKLRGVELVWTAHDLLNHEREAIRTELAFKHVIIRLLVDGIIVHCSSAKQIVRETYRLPERVEERMTVIPHGHFVDEYPNEVDRAEARSRLDIPEQDTVFLFFGWIRRYKNVPLLVDTFAELDDDDARLLVVGNPRTEEIEQEVRDAAATDSRVETRLEFVPDDEVQYYMNAADVAVLPFRTGKQTLLTSGSALLAMSFGKPVIAPALGCVADLVDEAGGFAYESSDRDALLGAMAAAMDADLAAMGAHNFERVSDLTWDEIAARTHEVYLDVVGGRRGGPGQADGAQGD